MLIAKAEGHYHFLKGIDPCSCMVGKGATGRYLVNHAIGGNQSTQEAAERIHPAGCIRGNGPGNGPGPRRSGNRPSEGDKKPVYRRRPAGGSGACGVADTAGAACRRRTSGIQTDGAAERPIG